MRLLLLFCMFIFLTGCEFYSKKQLDKTYGEAEVVDRITQHEEHTDAYMQAQDVLDKRCVVCHACYDAPCQLKLGSSEGIDRGASKEKVYDGKRLLPAKPSRLYVDEKNTQAWRERGFSPVLNEREQTGDANLYLSVMYQVLSMKKDFPLPDARVLKEDFDFSTKRDESCPTIEEINKHKEDHAFWGMPFGLPAISDKEFTSIESWLKLGGRFNEKSIDDKNLLAHVAQWEAFFNGQSLKEQLVNRYLYEHLYLANLYFSDESRQYFKLVRSRTAPGEPIDIIATVRVYDDPKEKFYYRLMPVFETIVAKTHMPYKLDHERKAFWQEIFYQVDYEVTELPGYEVNIASNPFFVFKQLPPKSRYRFLLEEAQYSIMNFIKGPVCRGQIAVDVIRDHFWVVFVSPDIDTGAEKWYIDQYADLLKMPASWESGGSFLAWHDLAGRQKKFLAQKVEYYNQHLGRSIDLDMNLIWDGGEKRNPNAALTVFRHFDSASVIKGFAGEKPKTAWVLNYPLMERIHYLLVAGFDVYGNFMHQLYTRLYMDFLRMEGEAQFIAFLPKEERLGVFQSWYIDADDKVEDYFTVFLESFKADTAIQYGQGSTKQQLLDMLIKRTSAEQYAVLEQDYGAGLVDFVNRLQGFNGLAVSFLPQTAMLKIVTNHNGVHWFNILHNNEHKNITNLFFENKARLPDKDNLTILPGVITAYPNIFFEVHESDLALFASQVETMQSEADYAALLDSYGVRRTDKRFWSYSDELHEAYKKFKPVEYGVLDYNRFENR